MSRQMKNTLIFAFKLLQFLKRTDTNIVDLSRCVRTNWKLHIPLQHK